MDLVRAKTQNPAHLYLATLSKKGRVSIACQLRSVARRLTGNDSIETLTWSAIDRPTILALLETIRTEGKSPATINHTLTALRRVCEEAYHLNQMDRQQYEGVMRVARDKGKRHKGKVPPSREEVRAALQRRLQTLSLLALRDATLVSVLAGAGLRKAEAIGCSTADYLNGKLRIVGKGNLETVQPVAPSARDLLDEYLPQIPVGPLFPAWQKNDNPSSRPLSPSGVDKVVARVLPGFTPHQLRHAYASWLSEDGHTLPVIQRLMRHSTPALTMRYIHNDAAQQAASDALSF
jgi:integrase